MKVPRFKTTQEEATFRLVLKRRLRTEHPFYDKDDDTQELIRKIKELSHGQKTLNAAVREVRKMRKGF